MIFDRFSGVRDEVVGEGTHFLIPWVQKPIIFDIRSRPRSVPTITGSKGMSFLTLYVMIHFSNRFFQFTGTIIFMWIILWRVPGILMIKETFIT